MSWYSIHDKISTSAVEQARNDYRKAIRTVEDAVASIREDIARLRDSEAGDLPKFYGAGVGDTSSGQFVTGFESSLDRWKTTLDGLIGPSGALTQAATDLEDKLTLLRSRKAKLDDMCAIEDDREREYDEDDIPF